MRKSIQLGISLALLLTLMVGCGNQLVQLTDDGIVRLVFFYGETCSHCHQVMEEDLPTLIEKFGDALEIAFIETTDPANYELYLAAIDLYEVQPRRQGIPALYIADHHLVGAIEIPNQLEGLVQEYLDQGGLDYPAIPGLNDYLDSPAASVQGGSGESVSGVLYVLYFYQTGCDDCDRVKGDINYLQSKFPQMVVDEYNVRDEATFSEWMGARNGVPPMSRLTAPTIFVGDDYLLEEELDARSLEELLLKYEAKGAERVWENWEKEGADAEEGILNRFESFGVLTIVLAGLVDGLNPCAFATLVFFVSYLSVSGRKGREVLIVGTAFTLGVFIAYMAVGVGFYKILEAVDELLQQLGKWVFGLTGVFCIVLAVITFFDYLKARRGDIGDMALNLPKSLRMRINATIRKSRHSKTFVGGAFATGIIVSFLELACTGQVYLPTIIYVVSMPDYQAKGMLYLLLYNLLFILPLVVVFVLAYYGTGAQKLSRFLQERASTVKLGLMVLFLALGSWLLISVF